MTDDGVNLALAALRAGLDADGWDRLWALWTCSPTHVQVAALQVACASLPPGITERTLRRNWAGALSPRRGAT